MNDVPYKVGIITNNAACGGAACSPQLTSEGGGGGGRGRGAGWWGSTSWVPSYTARCTLTARWARCTLNSGAGGRCALRAARRCDRSPVLRPSGIDAGGWLGLVGRRWLFLAAYTVALVTSGHYDASIHYDALQQPQPASHLGLRTTARRGFRPASFGVVSGLLQNLSPFATGIIGKPPQRPRLCASGDHGRG
jgi:hypothetical protein